MQVYNLFFLIKDNGRASMNLEKEILLVQKKESNKYQLMLL
jgi:hypothetical protein